MNCPSCKHQLTSYSYKNVQLDKCPHCHGMWFDKDELRKAKDRTDNDLRWMDFQLFDEKPNKYSAKTESKKICPKCQLPLHSQEYMHSKIRIDRCSQCDGVWLDDEEFNKIIDYLEKKIITETASEYQEDVKEQFKEVFSGDENKISEMKDLFVVMNLYEMRVMAEHPKLAEAISLANIEWAMLTGL